MRAEAGTSIRSGDRNDRSRALVADLLSLIDHVQTSIKQLERTVAAEKASGNSDTASNVVELDDVTPRYIIVSTALNACKTDLGEALDSLLDTRHPHDGRKDVWPRMRLAGGA